MKKIILVVITLLIIGGGGFALLRLRGSGGEEQGVLKVNSTPATTIFLDNQNIGKSPYEDKVKPGVYTLKLIPESSIESATSWEGQIEIKANLLTYINRELGESDVTTGGEILTLEKISGKQAELSVLSTPDGATVSLAGQEKGTTPLVIQDVDAGSYDLTVSMTGFKPRTVKVKTTAGYKLTASFQLVLSGDAPVGSPEPSASEEPDSTPKASAKASPKSTPKASAAKGTPPPKPYVEILDTPTGFLRVRSEPSTSSEELGRVNPGEYYSLLDEENGWYKIQFGDEEEGWISGQYADKFE